jgi:hypothetical protein
MMNQAALKRGEAQQPRIPADEDFPRDSDPRTSIVPGEFNDEDAALEKEGQRGQKDDLWKMKPRGGGG